MNVFHELRKRRVPQIAGAYLVGAWGALQFLAFLESRMAISPNLVNLIGLSLLLLLPTVLTLAWVHGRPGKDEWGKAPKVVLPANVVAGALLLFFIFQGRDLGAVTQTIEVKDENGAVTERVIPKNEYRRRVLVFYPEYDGVAEDAWASETLAFLVNLDASQDLFLDVVIPMSLVDAFKNAGHDDGHGLSRPLQRKIARDAHLPFFMTSRLAKIDDQWQLTTQLYESESGKLNAEQVIVADNLFSLTDQTSRLLRTDMSLPSAHLDSSQDLAVADLTSTDILAVKDHVLALIAVTHHNDWAAAVPLLEDAVARDESFALAQFLLFSVRQTLGDSAGASTAMALAMENLYRVPERLGFMIKAQYYYNEKKDADKAVAILRMWTQIYPNDVAAYTTEATFLFIRQDINGAIKALEKVLEIDPSQVAVFDQLADFHTQLGNYDAAEKYLKKYIAFFPTRADGYADLSEFYSNIGRLDEAREMLTQAQLLEPENTALALDAVDLDIKAGLYKKAATTLVQLSQSDPSQSDQSDILMHKVKLARRQGHTSQIVDLLEAHYSLSLQIHNPLQANIVYTMMLPAVSTGGLPEVALARLAEIKTLIPQPYDDLTGVGEAWALADLGLAAEATAKLTEALVVIDMLKFETYRPTVAMVEGKIAEADGDLEGAAKLYQQAVDTAVRGRANYRLHLAHVQRLLGQEEAAYKTITDALKIDPVFPKFQLELAQLLYTQGDASKAQQLLDQALAAWATADAVYVPAQEARRLANTIDAP